MLGDRCARSGAGLRTHPARLHPRSRSRHGRHKDRRRRTRAAEPIARPEARPGRRPSRSLRYGRENSVPHGVVEDIERGAGARIDLDQRRRRRSRPENRTRPVRRARTRERRASAVSIRRPSRSAFDADRAHGAAIAVGPLRRRRRPLPAEGEGRAGRPDNAQHRNGFAGDFALEVVALACVADGRGSRRRACRRCRRCASSASPLDQRERMFAFRDERCRAAAERRKSSRGPSCVRRCQARCRSGETGSASRCNKLRRAFEARSRAPGRSAVATVSPRQLVKRGDQGLGWKSAAGECRYAAAGRRRARPCRHRRSMSATSGR